MGIYTLFESDSIYFELGFSLEVFGVTTFSTYLEETPFHGKIPCDRVDMVQLGLNKEQIPTKK
jgi:hypothetical protein